MSQRPPFVPAFARNGHAIRVAEERAVAARRAREVEAAPPLIDPAEIKCEGDRLTMAKCALAQAGLLSDPAAADAAILAAYAADGLVRDRFGELSAEIEALKLAVKGRK